MVYQQHIHNQLSLSTGRLNGTEDRDQEIMLFVRIPKTGRNLMNHLLRQQSKMNNFTAIESVKSMPNNINGGEYLFETNQHLR